MIQLIDFIWPYLVGMVIGWVLCGYLARRYLKLSPAQEKSVVVRDTRTVEVDNPIHLKRISDLEARIYQLNSRPPEVIEKETTKTVVVDNPVHLERVVALENQVVELQSREVEEKIIEKRVEVDNPEHLERIVTLEKQLVDLQNREPEARVIETRVEIDNPEHLERIAGLEQQLVELQNQQPVERVIETQVEVDNPQHLERIAELESKLASFESSTTAEQTELEKTDVSMTADINAAKAAGFSIKSENDFTVIEGIGPKINEHLHNNGIDTYIRFSETKVDFIQQLLDEGGKRFRLAKPRTWPQQAKLAAQNRWQELKTLQDELRGGV